MGDSNCSTPQSVLVILTLALVMDLGILEHMFRVHPRARLDIDLDHSPWKAFSLWAACEANPNANYLFLLAKRIATLTCYAIMSSDFDLHRDDSRRNRVLLEFAANRFSSTTLSARDDDDGFVLMNYEAERGRRVV